MAYTLNVGTCACENNVVDKSGSVNLGQDISCVMVNTDSLNPVFKVDGTRSGSNYCYCSEFGRYYFIESVEALAGGHCLYHCHVDVLYTYKDQIKALTCLVARNENINKWKRDINDLNITVSNRRVGYSRTFGTHFISSSTSGDEYVFGYV